uniref:Endophilin-B1-like n=1 Tax=Seriola lalandi dorsalis TaxID=1841481 RepID=A0A3B4YP26_SERLL
VVMDLTRLAVDAGQFINRAVQYTEESIGQADKTELEPGLEQLLALADATKTCTDKIICQTEVLLQPNPGARLEDRLYEHLDWSVPSRPRALEALGDQMTQAGLEIGSTTPYGESALLRCGEVQKQLSEEERKLVQSTNIHFLTPLRSFTEGEFRDIQDERRMLVNKRLDLDIAKTRLRKAHEADREARAEMELRICQSLFDRQTEMTRRALEGISNTHTNHMRSLTDFVEAQACFFDQCNQHAQELQKQVARCVLSAAVINGAGSAVPTASSQPPQPSGTVNEPQTANAVACETMTTSAVADEPQTTNETANEQPTINGDVQELVSGGGCDGRPNQVLTLMELQLN